MLQKANPLIEFAGNQQGVQIRRFGLIGSPIAHSLSPALFRAGYGIGNTPEKECNEGQTKERNIEERSVGHQDVGCMETYSYDLIEGDDFESSYRTFLDCYDGINVTAPFKELAYAKADIKSPECLKIGATNLLVKTSEGIKAYNSDYYGIMLSILTAMYPDKDAEQFLPVTDIDMPQPCEEFSGTEITRDGNSGEPSGSWTTPQKTGKSMKALVVGCGGAGKAAAVATGDLGFSVTLMNRTPDKAEAIATALPEYGFSVRQTRDFKDCFTEADIIIYTLPCPLKELDDMLRENGIGKTAAAPGRPHQTTSPTGCAKAMRMESKRKLILEANYKNPSLSNMVLKPGCAECPSFPIPAAEYISGKRWLLYQAYTGYSLFTGQIPDLHAMEEAMKF